MLTTIGIMVGAYIFTRMYELSFAKDATWGTKTLASITAIIAFFGTLSIIVTWVVFT